MIALPTEGLSSLLWWQWHKDHHCRPNLHTRKSQPFSGHLSNLAKDNTSQHKVWNTKHFQIIRGDTYLTMPWPFLWTIIDIWTRMILCVEVGPCIWIWTRSIVEIFTFVLFTLNTPWICMPRIENIDWLPIRHTLVAVIRLNIQN
jgi:hypothetical protein